MHKLPIGIQSFESIRTENYLYVDKTAYINQLVNDGKFYFLSRPRRFGKSLLISTLEAYFLGKKELFHGLYIEEQENQREKDAWTAYPVIHFSLAGGMYQSEEGLSDVLNGVLNKYAQRYEMGFEADKLPERDLPGRFRTLIEALYHKTGRKVVVLVDEYDKPLLENMGVNEEQEEKNRSLYKGFFGVLKDEDPYLKFAFFTGVTKFSKVSIFSDLNQLWDISMSQDYADICGITQSELEDNFPDEIQKLAESQSLSTEQCLARLRKMYDGYHFHPSDPGVYNPFSLLNALVNREFGSYWFETGTPTFLINVLKKSDYTPEDFSEGVQAAKRDIKNYRSDSKDPIPLFYQSGYLTISAYAPRYRMYTLTFPNEEVKSGFLNSLFPDVIHRSGPKSSLLIEQFSKDLEGGNVDAFMARLSSLFASIPYREGEQKPYETEWRNEMFLLLELIGENVQAEKHFATGRADCIVETEEYVYIFEFKLDQSAEAALQQIEEKGYAKPYASDSRKIYKIGVNFSSEQRNVESWESQK